MAKKRLKLEELVQIEVPKDSEKCQGCYFYTQDCFHAKCVPSEREDGKNIVYQEGKKCQKE